MTKNLTEVKRDVYKVDATGMAIGRLASDVAAHLIGKHKPGYETHIDVGDFVEVSNVDKVTFTGKKYEQHLHYTHSSQPGGLKTKTTREIFEKNPTKLLQIAVSRMLPKNQHRTERLKRLKTV